MKPTSQIATASSWFRRCGLAAVLAALPCGAAFQPDRLSSGADKVQIPGVVRALAGMLADADRLAAQKQWQEAIDAYLVIIREHGDDLIPISPSSEPLASGQRFVQARWLVHQHVAGLPPAALAAFRNRMDGVAKKWLDQSTETRDVRLLRRIVEDAFCSRPAEKALELLGDFAFERGDFAEAQHWWRMLAAPVNGGDWVSDGTKREIIASATAQHSPFNDETVLARVRAKQILCMLFQEQAHSVPAALMAYRTVHGTVTGTLAGRNGNYANIIEALAKQGQGSLPAAEQDWPTFAGDPSRNRELPIDISPQLWADGPAWRVWLDSGERVSESAVGRLSETKTLPRSLSHYPIVFGGVSYVADSRFVRGFDLRSGKLVFQFDLLAERKAAGMDAIRLQLSLPDVRYTLTAADGYLCIRMGARSIGPPPNGQKQSIESRLVCFRLASGSFRESVLAWTEAALSKDEEEVIFEGSPIIHHKAVIIARTRLKGSRSSTSICSFDAQTGSLRWEQEICEAIEFGETTLPRSMHYLLTLAGPNIVYCSHAGAIVALDADTGKRAWAVRYPGRGLKTREGQPTPRDLCPPVAAGRRLIVAPADTDRVFCLDATTGSSLWELEGVDVVHLLGVARGRVLFTTATGLRAVNAATGEDWSGGWRQPLAGNLASRGRGFLASGWVFWPTQDAKLPWRAVHILDGKLLHGTQSFDASVLRSLATGNVAFGHGCLVIATADELFGYVPPQPPKGPPHT